MAGLQDGTIDAIATDHAPHAPELKAKPLGSDAPFGLIGLETALGLALTRLVHTGKISMWHLISLMSANPSRIVNQPYGRLSVGAPADITIFDPTPRVDLPRRRKAAPKAAIHLSMVGR